MGAFSSMRQHDVGTDKLYFPGADKDMLGVIIHAALLLLNMPSVATSSRQPTDMCSCGASGLACLPPSSAF